MQISIHFLYTEEDPAAYPVAPTLTHFNPLPLYRGRLWAEVLVLSEKEISIHFLYTEEDLDKFLFPYFLFHFNPLPLYRGRLGILSPSADHRNFNPLPLYRGRHVKQDALAPIYEFQSTSSIQRKTANINK